FLGPQYWDFNESQTPSQNTAPDCMSIDLSPPLPTPTNDQPPAQQQPVPQQQGTTTRSGRTIRPPGEWWKANTRHQGETQDEPQSERPSNIGSDASTDYDDDHPMPDAPALDESTSSAATESTLLVEGLAFSATLIPEPKSYQQAKASAEWTDWRKAMDEELQSLKDNQVWKVVPKPTNRKIVDCKWVYKVKTDANGNLERYKARLVARGFTQVPGQDFDRSEERR